MYTVSYVEYEDAKAKVYYYDGEWLDSIEGISVSANGASIKVK